MVMDGDLTWVMDTVQCTDDVLWNCAPETCIILLASITPIHSIKKKKRFIVYLIPGLFSLLNQKIIVLKENEYFKLINIV